MNIFSTFGHYFINTYIFTIVTIKSFFLLFVSNSIAAFATGFIMIFFLFSFFVRIWSRDRTFFQSLKNPSIIIVVLMANLLLLWITDDLSIDFTEKGRQCANTSLFVLFTVLMTAGSMNGDVLTVERGIRRSRDDYYDED